MMDLKNVAGVFATGMVIGLVAGIILSTLYFLGIS